MALKTLEVNIARSKPSGQHINIKTKKINLIVFLKATLIIKLKLFDSYELPENVYCYKEQNLRMLLLLFLFFYFLLFFLW